MENNGVTQVFVVLIAPGLEGSFKIYDFFLWLIIQKCFNNPHPMTGLCFS